MNRIDKIVTVIHASSTILLVVFFVIAWLELDSMGPGGSMSDLLAAGILAEVAFYLAWINPFIYLATLIYLIVVALKPLFSKIKNRKNKTEEIKNENK